MKQKLVKILSILLILIMVIPNIGTESANAKSKTKYKQLTVKESSVKNNKYNNVFKLNTYLHYQMNTFVADNGKKFKMSDIWFYNGKYELNESWLTLSSDADDGTIVPRKSGTWKLTFYIPKKPDEKATKSISARELMDNLDKFYVFRVKIKVKDKVKSSKSLKSEINAKRRTVILDGNIGIPIPESWDPSKIKMNGDIGFKYTTKNLISYEFDVIEAPSECLNERARFYYDSSQIASHLMYGVTELKENEDGTKRGDSNHSIHRKSDDSFVTGTNFKAADVYMVFKPLSLGTTDTNSISKMLYISGDPADSGRYVLCFIQNLNNYIVYQGRDEEFRGRSFDVSMAREIIKYMESIEPDLFLKSQEEIDALSEQDREDYEFFMSLKELASTEAQPLTDEDKAVAKDMFCFARAVK